MSRKKKSEIHKAFGKDISGNAILFKNDNPIREKRFKKRWERKLLLDEYIALCKIGTEDSYYIIIKLDEI